MSVKVRRRALQLAMTLLQEYPEWVTTRNTLDRWIEGIVTAGGDGSGTVSLRTAENVQKRPEQGQAIEGARERRRPATGGADIPGDSGDG